VLSTPATTEDAVGVDVQERSRERNLGGRVTQYRVSIGRQLGAPQFIGLLDFEGHRFNVSERRVRLIGYS
jgi:hypothetical protein